MIPKPQRSTREGLGELSVISIDLPPNFKEPKLRLLDRLAGWFWWFRYNHGLLTAREIREMDGDDE